MAAAATFGMTGAFNDVVLALRRDSPEEGARPALLRWGLVPSWAKEAKIGNRMINARSETAADKPSFRSAIRRRRCLIPADGFFEWQPRPKGKLPHYIYLADGRPLALDILIYLAAGFTVFSGSAYIKEGIRQLRESGHVSPDSDTESDAF